MLKPWWERWPERLEHELEALRATGIPFELDEEARAAGIIKLRLSPTIDGERLRLEAIFPDLYPYVRFEVLAPDLDLEHHQNPFTKNLCLIGRSTWNWCGGDTLAEFITARLPLVLKAARTGDREAVAGIEEQQGEPITNYYPYPKDAMVLVDGSWSLPPSAGRGEFVIGLLDLSGPVLRGAVLKIQEAGGGAVATADPAFSRLYTKLIRGRWVRAERPIWEADPNRFLHSVVAAHRDLERPLWNSVQGWRLDVIGVVFPEEVGWSELGDGWIFVVRAEELKSRRRAARGLYFARAGRAGRADLSSRVPDLAAVGERRVALVGLGGVGAPSALEFARSGIKELRILDHDIVEPGTIVRWPLGMPAAGLGKAEAIGRFVASHYPYTQVVAWPHRIGNVLGDGPRDLQVLEELLDGVDLIYDATAEVGLQHLLSDLAGERQIPYVCASTTPGGWGGLVARVRPGQTEGCWSCLQWHLTGNSIPSPPADPAGMIQPRGCADPTFTGAGFDVAEIALAGVRVAVSTLCGAAGKGYPEAQWDVAVIALRNAQGEFTVPIWQTFPLTRHPSCACGRRT